METDRTEITGEDGGPIKVELEVALKKIYGDQGSTESRPTVIEAKVIETGNAERGLQNGNAEPAGRLPAAHCKEVKS